MNEFSKYKMGIIIIEAQSIIPERFINMLWKHNIDIKKVYKKNLTTLAMEVQLKDFNEIEECAKKTNTKITILERRGLSFFWIKLRKRTALVFGVALFAGILYYLSTFIWGIDIETDKSLSPYEIRQQLNALGVKAGVSKKNLNVYELQDKIYRSDDSVMYILIRPEGSRLKVKVAQKTPPPEIVSNNSPCNLVAKRDGEISRIYTTAGTAIVKKGNIVKKGQLLVKGEQGKEGNVFQVHAQGDVIARTFYEAVKEVEVTGVKKERTGNFIRNYYIELGNKKIYLKNSLNKFKIYDKIIVNNKFMKEEVFYEVREVPFVLDSKQVVDSTFTELYDKLVLNLEKSVKIVDKILESEPLGNTVRVRVAVIGEENIAMEEKLQ